MDGLPDEKWQDIRATALQGKRRHAIKAYRDCTGDGADGGEIWCAILDELRTPGPRCRNAGRLPG